MTTTAERVAAVRTFNRFYTNVVGVLHEGLLRTPYSVTEARVLFELAQHETTEVAEMRPSLDIDAGYLSRILASFEADGLATRERSILDGRRQVIRLTGHGRRACRMLDKRSTEEIGNLLSPLTEEQQQCLIGAMQAIEATLDGSRSERPLVLRPPGPGDLGWVVHRHGVLYAEEYGWDERFEALVARIVADYVDHRDLQREAAWIAEVHGRPVGSIFCLKKDEKVAQLRLLLVEPDARAGSIATRLVEECIRFARHSGYEQMMLWTNDVLEDARRIYEKVGFELRQEEKHRSFGHELVGQNWWLEL